MGLSSLRGDIPRYHFSELLDEIKKNNGDISDTTTADCSFIILCNSLEKTNRKIVLYPWDKDESLFQELIDE